MKPVYLNHYFFASFSREGRQKLTMLLQKLKNSNYIHRTAIGGGLPHKVIKLTDRGIRQYYNQLVIRREIENPTWWIHHLHQLENRLRSPVDTGGETMEFSGRIYLSQAPAFVEADQRVKDEKTIRLEGFNQIKPGQTVMIKAAEVNPENGVILCSIDETEVKNVSVVDLRSGLTHFPVIQDETGGENPFLLKGELVNISDKNSTGRRYLTFSNSRGKKIKLLLEQKEIPKNVEEKIHTKFCFGPVEEINEEYDDKIFHLQLRTGGEIRPASPTFPG